MEAHDFFSSIEESSRGSGAKRKKDQKYVTKVVVIDRSGERSELDVPPKGTFMDVLRDGGFDELEAMCGGSCSCATCHVYVDPSFAALLPPIGEDESELLDGSEHRTEKSRLSCQIRLNEELDGIMVTIAPEG